MYRFRYSSHRSRYEAEQALEDYYASGEVGDGDSPLIVPTGGNGKPQRWSIMLAG
jgi:hypothetical protein